MMPALFISHGSPMLALEKGATMEFLRKLAAKLPVPRAIIVASAHWETEQPLVTGSAHPETMHDFHGFPKELYQLRYPAPGEPALAETVAGLLREAGMAAAVDSRRGLDHGVWNPLLLTYPKADIPVVELSVQPGRDAHWHYRIGQALQGLSKQNILIVGTGNLTHNLREALRGHHETVPVWVTEFAEWVAKEVAEENVENLLQWESLAPYAKQNHPSPEHFLPFFVALGAAGKPLHAKRLYNDTTLGVLAMDAYMFGN